MKNFRDNRGGFRGGGGDRGNRPMFKATCANCGKSCEVPFRPTGDKPVYCRDCFAKRGGGADRSQSGGSAGNENIIKQLEEVNAKLERLISAVSAKKVSKKK